MHTAWRIGRISELVSKYTPWESKCLVQVLMVRALLAYYHIPYVMHLGVTKAMAQESGEEGDSIMKAHAWLSVGAWVVSGGDGHRAFTIVATFVQPSLLDNVDSASVSG